MNRLTAKYTIQLDELLVIKRAEDEVPTFQITIDDFDISISIPNRFVSGVRSKAERLMTRTCYMLEVSVSRDELEAPPPPGHTDRGGIDYTVQSTYFGLRTERYASMAAEALNRFFLFLRHRLRQPLLEPITHRNPALLNPSWFDETGAEAGKGAGVFVVPDVPRRFGVIPLEAKHYNRLTRALGRRLVPKLYDELLSDAQATALRGNLRRAVLELAVACEVAVKRKFFGRSSGGRTIEYLEDKRRFQVPVVELIGKAADDVFGHTFKSAHPAAYTDIENLFHCRNKVAHRGQPIFRPQNMPVQTVTPEILGQWLSSARALFLWLKKLRHR
jgi:hypothetical protein